MRKRKIELLNNKYIIILSRVCGDYIWWVLDWQLDLLDHIQVRTTTVYALLQLLTFHYNTCRVSSLCLHWLPVFQYLTRLALQDWPTDARPEYSLFCILKTRSLQLTRQDCGVLTSSARLYSMAGPLLSHVMFTAHASAILLRHVRHSVYFTLYCCLVAIATVVHNRHIAYSMHVPILLLHIFLFYVPQDVSAYPRLNTTDLQDITLYWMSHIKLKIKISISRFLSVAIFLYKNNPSKSICTNIEI
jgi:hypothetical protein